MRPFPVFARPWRCVPATAEGLANPLPPAPACLRMGRAAGIPGRAARSLDPDRALQGGQAGEPPFVSISRSMDPARNHAVAKAASDETQSRMQASVSRFPIAHPRNARRIVLGYLSGDYRNHPVAHLLGGLLGAHDRERFQIQRLFLWARTTAAIYRSGPKREADNFVDLRRVSSLDAARRIYGDEVDILIDLTGRTGEHRLDICALRPAPVQVSWLGYPGTSGGAFMDYIMADRIVAPAQEARWFSRKAGVATPLLSDQSRPSAGQQRQSRQPGIGRAAGAGLRLRLLCQQLQNRTGDLRQLAIAAAPGSRQRALAAAQQPAGGAQPETGRLGRRRRSRPADLRRQARQGRSSGAPWPCRSGARYPALYRAYDDERRALGGASGGHDQRRPFCLARVGEHPHRRGPAGADHRLAEGIRRRWHCGSRAIPPASRHCVASLPTAGQRLPCSTAGALSPIWSTPIKRCGSASMPACRPRPSRSRNRPQVPQA